MRTFQKVHDLLEANGEHLGYSDWVEVTQDKINLFAEATGDHQWIHVDSERAAQGPFGATIAHGWLTISLSPMLEEQIYEVLELGMGVNYGAEKLRFLSPVVVGSNVRMGVEVIAVATHGEGIRLVTRQTIEIRGVEKPACVADVVSLLYP